MYLKAYKASNIPIYLRDIFMVLTNEEADRILSGKEKAYTIDELVSLLGISKSTIERWRRDSQSQGLGLNLGSVVANNSVIGKTMQIGVMVYQILMMMSRLFLSQCQIFI